MEWLIETLRVLREVRDWTDRRSATSVRSDATKAAVHRAALAAEAAAGASPIVLDRIGPAMPPAPRKKPSSPRSGSPRIPINKIDPNAASVVRRLKRHKHKAYLVGGCVRDLLLGVKPKDFDIATDAKPEEIKAIFRNSRIIGRRFRLVHLYFRGGQIIEVATFRAGVTNDTDEEDPDLLIRRDNVFGTEQEDALRRDFTINGLFYDVTTGEITDHVDGLPDVERRYLRMIGDPDIRLREDPVRILRAIRFKAKLDITIDPDLFEAMVRCKDEIRRCAPARVLEESLRLLRIGFATETVSLMVQTGVLEVLLPRVQQFLDDAEPIGIDVSGGTDEPHFVERERLGLVLDHLSTLDEIIRREGEVSDAVALGALIAAPLTAELDRVEEEGGDRNRAVADWLDQLGSEVPVTKRMHEQLRQMFMAQRHMSRRVPPGKKRRRRISPNVLMRRGFFPDALLLFEISLRGNDQSLEDLEYWNELARDRPPVDDEDDAGMPRKRRRRGGGGGGGGGRRRRGGRPTP